MSLHFTLYVNGRSVYHAVDITRLDSTDRHPPADRTFAYRVCAVAEDGANPARQWTATFSHCYGDGALECVRKALNAIADESGGVIA